MGTRRSQRSSGQLRIVKPRPRAQLTEMSGPASRYTPIQPAPPPRPQLHYPPSPSPYPPAHQYPDDQPGPYLPYDSSEPDSDPRALRPFRWARPEDLRSPGWRNGQLGPMSSEVFEYRRQQPDGGSALPPFGFDLGDPSSSSHPGDVPTYADSALTQGSFDRLRPTGAVGNGNGGISGSDGSVSGEGGLAADAGSLTDLSPGSVGAAIPGDASSVGTAPASRPGDCAESEPFVVDSAVAAESPSLDALVDEAFAVTPFETPDEDPVAAAFARFDAEAAAFAEPDSLAMPSNGGLDERVDSFGESPFPSYGGLEQIVLDGGLVADPMPPKPPGAFG